jgi:hypothetical protein
VLLPILFQKDTKMDKMKKFKKIAITALIASQIVSVSTVANADLYDDEGNLSLGQCFSNGGMDFVAFMQASSFVDGFEESLLQPWVDVLARNQCQAMDLITLIDAQDSRKSQIRDAFLTCNNEKIPELKKLYYELTAEIYYARHIVDEEALKGLSKDTATDPGMVANIFTNKARIYSDMKERYVRDGYFTQEEFDDFFDELDTAYADRKYDYVLCEGSSWGEVSEKWTEFKENFTEDLGGLKEFGEGVAGEWKNIAQEAKTMKVVSLLKDNEESFGSFLGSFVNTSINGLNVDDFADEFAEDALKNIPSFDVGTQKDFVTNIQSSTKAFEIEEIEKKMRSNFVVLYGTTGDESIELFLNNLDGRGDHLEDTEGFIEITEQSYPNLTKMQDDIDTILSKQCE